MIKRLSKSDLRLYLDSPRHLWAKFHDAWHPEFTDFDKKTTEDGYRVEKLAMEYLERYCAVDGKILKKQQTFSDGEFLARTDGLIYDPSTDTYDLYEIKSYTFDEDEPDLDKTNLYDITFQSVILEKSIKLKNKYLLMLNANYRCQSDSDLKLLFRLVEVSDKIEEIKTDIQNYRQEMLNIAQMDKYSGLEACFSPKTCGCKNICHPDLPENNIYEILSRSHGKVVELRDAGILDISDIPQDFELSGKAGTLIKVYRGSERFIDRENIKKILDEYKYPIYFLDYETISDPGINRNAAESYPEMAEQLLKVNGRIKDLGDSFKYFYYIDKRFHCSWSIKKVLPVVCPECSYKELPINHGDQASSEWIRMNSDETRPEEKAEIKENLLRYCELDTWAMVRIWQELRKEC